MLNVSKKQPLINLLEIGWLDLSYIWQNDATASLACCHPVGFN